MSHVLNDEERMALDDRIAKAEKKTGTQIVLALIERSDAYPEIPWKSFALGVSVSSLVVLILNNLWPFTPPAMAVLVSIVIILGTGTGLALLCVFIPDVARLFLSADRAEAETRQYAESLFLAREIFSTPDRRAVLLMISLFEHRIVILPDTGLAGQIDDAGTAEKIISGMRPHLKAGRLAQALDAGLDGLENLIIHDGKSISPAVELPNTIIQEKGA